MGIGQYRHRVTLEDPLVVLDPPTWDCSLQSAATQVVDGLVAFFVRGRFHPGITLETQMLFEGRTFQVQSITDLDERHTELQLMCVEVVGRGTSASGPPLAVPPTITAPPVGSSIAPGESATLTVIASGAAPLAYQWTQAGVDIAGATQPFYVTGALVTTTVYAVRVSNAYGSVTSAPVTVTVSTGALSYQETVLADGAVAYWPLDDPPGSTTARDLAGTRHGAISGGVLLGQPGIGTSTAMVFNGTTSKILPSTFPVVAPACTLEAWMRPSVLQAPGPILCKAIFGDGDFIWSVRSLEGVVRLYYYFTVAHTLDWTVTIPSNAWTHLVVTAASGQAILYVNGIVISPTQALTLGGPGPGPPGLGCLPDGDTAFQGALQDLAIYPRALTVQEIAAHYSRRITTHG